ncbi:MAG: TIGR04283 family arsenosugar biosynthesis glycosyltransferase [Pseudomonadota bacterium]|nr:TIGR04283 family arsenosugar biosynthesis glycosyltransferase [Pseudomonadota bacterium]
MRISVVMPVLNEARLVRAAVDRLQPLRKMGHELIVVDGGSSDGTPELAQLGSDLVVCTGRGRGTQLARGAEASTGDLLLFVHVDTLLPDLKRLHALAQSGVWSGGWGFHALRLDGRGAVFRCIERAVSWRSRWTGIGTGDQAIFVDRGLYQRAGGFAAIPLMEDIELCKRLRRRVRPHWVADPVVTSSRRWESRGVARTVVLMWAVRFAYWCGASPERLSRWYAA